MNPGVSSKDETDIQTPSEKHGGNDQGKAFKIPGAGGLCGQHPRRHPLRPSRGIWPGPAPGFRNFSIY